MVCVQARTAPTKRGIAYCFNIIMILFVGNSDNESLELVKLSNPTVIPIVHKSQISELNKISIGFVSLCDHSIEDFISILLFADELIYVASELWNHQDTKLKTEAWVRYFSHTKEVKNIPFYTTTSNILDLEDKRKCQSRQLWIGGDSFTAGIGVSKNQRWGQLVADKLNLPVSFLARDSASNPWVADQILRSNISKEDIVIWALTGIGRFTYFNQNTFEYLVNRDSSDKLISKKLLVATDYPFYLTKLAIDQVIKKSKNVGFTLAIVLYPFLTYEQDLELFNYLSQYNFLILGYNYESNGEVFIDLGSDNNHPGPKHHQYIADKIYKSLDQIIN